MGMSAVLIAIPLLLFVIMPITGWPDNYHRGLDHRRALRRLRGRHPGRLALPGPPAARRRDAPGRGRHTHGVHGCAGEPLLAGAAPPRVNPAWIAARQALHARFVEVCQPPDASWLGHLGLPERRWSLEDVADLWRGVPTQPGRLAPVNHVYVHVPFCKSICSFCNYERLRPTSPELLRRWRDRVLRPGGPRAGPRRTHLPQRLRPGGTQHPAGRHGHRGHGRAGLPADHPAARRAADSTPPSSARTASRPGAAAASPAPPSGSRPSTRRSTSTTTGAPRTAPWWGAASSSSGRPASPRCRWTSSSAWRARHRTASSPKSSGSSSSTARWVDVFLLTRPGRTWRPTSTEPGGLLRHLAPFQAAAAQRATLASRTGYAEPRRWPPPQPLQPGPRGQTRRLRSRTPFCQSVSGRAGPSACSGWAPRPAADSSAGPGWSSEIRTTTSARPVRRGSAGRRSRRGTGARYAIFSLRDGDSSTPGPSRPSSVSPWRPAFPGAGRLGGLGLGERRGDRLTLRAADRTARTEALLWLVPAHGWSGSWPAMRPPHHRSGAPRAAGGSTRPGAPATAAGRVDADGARAPRLHLAGAAGAVVLRLAPSVQPGAPTGQPDSCSRGRRRRPGAHAPPSGRDPGARRPPLAAVAGRPAGRRRRPGSG